MSDFDDDPLDLIDDGDGGAVEMSLLEEEEKRKRSVKNTNSGCSIAFLIISSSIVIAGWSMIQMFMTLFLLKSDNLEQFKALI